LNSDTVKMERHFKIDFRNKNKRENRLFFDTYQDREVVFVDRVELFHFDLVLLSYHLIIYKVHSQSQEMADDYEQLILLIDFE